MSDTGARQRLFEAFTAAVRAAQPARVVARFVPRLPAGKVIVVGAGKASAQMARALEDTMDRPLTGMVVTQYGCGCECRGVDVVEAAHPVPDSAGLAAAEAMLALVGDLGPDDLVVALMSGGGSALLPAPLAGLTLEDEIEVSRRLLKSGAPIAAMNAVRKHISRIKGGRLALAAGSARVVSLVLSDVPGDDPADVASGPTVPDRTDRSTVMRYIREHKIDLPTAVLDVIRSPRSTPPAPDHPAFSNNEVHVIASAQLSLKAAQQELARHGLRSVILADDMEGEAVDIAKAHAAIARQIARYGSPFSRPVVLLSGGETTVTHSGGGKGGRNSEFALAFALEIAGIDGICLLAADTDGRDGSEQNAGAFADGRSASRMRAAGVDPEQLLMDHDSWTAFASVADLVTTGPTGTNVNDFRAILVQ